MNPKTKPNWINKRAFDDQALAYIKDMDLQEERFNVWYQWVQYSAGEITKTDCVVCARSPLTKVIVVPNPYSSTHCAIFNRQFHDKGN